MPVVSPTAFIHPTAVLIGDVSVGDNCYVGPNAVSRGDFGRIIMEAGSKLQDTCVVHSFPEKDYVIEADGHIGHGAVLHGCRIGRNSLIGMNAVIMDEAIIGPEPIVAATAFIKAKFECHSRSLVLGNPGTVKRLLTEDEINWKTPGSREYQELTQRSLTSPREAEPLSSPSQIALASHKVSTNPDAQHQPSLRTTSVRIS
ncbi:MAG: phenylacetic acid degradation protein [Candidatus Azotimanducaceae bacterium]|jgi:phenylacetic acid degradation protein